MRINITLIAGNYLNTFNCPIAKALRRKGILASVGPDGYDGLFLGFIPVCGPISEELNSLAMHIKKPIRPKAVITIKLGWSRYKGWTDY